MATITTTISNQTNYSVKPNRRGGGWRLQIYLLGHDFLEKNQIHNNVYCISLLH